ncbi:DinB family protein [Nonlabens xiamenensis]|uniref:DinB family protein n=1 Tax=Nonlabens xiamenensis TaxID=2341043 RepID=UPI000F612050|nr:DinB family protein [Nonlabens xiamenensis]
MRILFVYFLFILGFLSPQQVLGQDQVYVDQYLERLEQSKKYLITVAELMPEEEYHYQPTEASMTFAEHLMHITWAMDWHSQSLIGDRPARDWETDNLLKVANKSKKEMIATVIRTFDNTISFIKNFNPDRLDERLDYFGQNRSKRQILMLLSDHVTHHRAQMLVYLRLKGLQPPRYVLHQ